MEYQVTKCLWINNIMTQPEPLTTIDATPATLKTQAEISIRRLYPDAKIYWSDIGLAAVYASNDEFDVFIEPKD